MSNKISIGNLTGEISRMLDEYSGAVASDVKDCCRKVAKETVKKLKSSSPERSGSYKKSWRSTVVAENSSGVQIVVHDGKYQLTHLLEFGHAKRGGGRVSPIPHVKQAEEEAASRLMEEIKKIL